MTEHGIRPMDLSLSFWIAGKPYQFDAVPESPFDVKEIIYDVESVKSYTRKYVLPPTWTRRIENPTLECKWVSNYFATHLPYVGHQLFWLEGRRWYMGIPPISSDSSKMKIGAVIYPLGMTEIYDTLPFVPHNGVEYDLATLICHSLLGTPSNILDELSQTEKCTKIFDRVATSLIRVAATRIFVEPEQSILEIPVNSMDAYRPEQRIGKFGMGFFSFLYWLIRHPKRFLRINSYFVVGADGSDEPMYGMFSAVIRERDAKLVFSITFYNSQTRLTGTQVYLDAKNDPFTTEEIKAFKSQIAKLAFTSSAALWITFDGMPSPSQRMNLADESAPPIAYSIDPAYLRVEDYATGIPPHVFLGSLLVPSISTKTLKLAPGNANFVPATRLDGAIPMINQVKASLSITVANIAVLQFTIPGYTVHPYNYILTLPPSVTLPVARDDLILDTSTAKIFETELIKLFDVALKSPKNKAVLWLQTLLEKLETHTSSEIMQKIITRVSQNFTRENASVLAPEQSVKILRSLQPGRAMNRFRASKTYDLTVVDQSLDRYTSNDNVWYGKNVIVTKLSGPIATSLDLPSYVFVDIIYTQTHKNWMDVLPLSYTESALFRISGGAEGTQFDKEIKLVSEIDQRAYRALRLRYERLGIYFSNIDDQRPGLITGLAHLHQKTPEIFAKACTALQNALSKIKGNATYGAAQNRLHIHQFPLAYTSRVNRSSRHRDLLKSLINESILLSLRTIEERPETQIHFSVSSCGLVGLLILVGDNMDLDMILDRQPTLTYLTFFLESCYRSGTKKPTESYLAFFDQRFKFHAIDFKSLQTLYLLMSADTHSTSILARTICDEMTIRTTMLRNLGEMETRVLPLQPNASKIVASWKISNLMSYLGVTAVPPKSFVKMSIDVERHTFASKDQISKGPQNQLVEIVVNEGTSRSFIPAMITELVQNAVDAIRTFKPKSTGLDMKLYVNKTHQSIVWEIQDYVGMSDEAMLAVSIPFYSTKTPSELVTGEMGSGFFNVYRESDLVVIRTPVGNTWERPIRDAKSGRVIDVQKIVTAPNPKWEGTQISVSIPYVTDQDKEIKIVEISTWLSGVIGLVDVPMLFNGSYITVARELLYQDEHYEISWIPKEVGEYAQHTSYLLTKGIPMAPLSGYLPEKTWAPEMKVEASSGIFINLRSDSYTPTQARSKVRMTTLAAERWYDILNCAMFLKALTKVANEKDTWLIQHWDSTQNATQLTFIASTWNNHTYVYGLSICLLYYPVAPGRTNLAKLFNKAISIVLSQPFSTKKNQVEKMVMDEIPDTYPKIRELVMKTISGWFAKKNTAIVAPPSVKTSAASLSLREIPGDDDPREKLLTSWVQTYWKLGVTARVTGIISRPPPKIRLVGKNPQKSAAWYVLTTHTIMIPFDDVATRTMWDDHTDDLIGLLTTGTTKGVEFEKILNTNPIWKSYFALKVPATTIIHELEHARRSQTHKGEGTHDKIFNALTPSDVPMERNFEASANFVYTTIIAQGLFDELAKILQ